VVAILEYETSVAPRKNKVWCRPDHEEPLVGALRRREPTAADELVASYHGRAYRLAISITRSAPDAEEVVQDAFWSVIRNIDTFRGDSSFGSWFYRIVSNAAFRKLRRRRSHRLEITMDEVLPVFSEDGRHAQTVVDWSAAVHDPARDTEIRLAITAAIAELPDHYRVALLLRDVEGCSLKQIAETLGISVENAKTRLHRARLFVRKLLTESLTVDSSRASRHGG
jgi:RNA polymerase sigma-70 factor (ECF subfamily)